MKSEMQTADLQTRCKAKGSHFKSPCAFPDPKRGLPIPAQNICDSKSLTRYNVAPKETSHNFSLYFQIPFPSSLRRTQTWHAGES